MATKRERRKKSSRSWVAIGGALALIVIAVSVWFVANARTSAQNVNALDVTASLPNTDTSFNVGTRVGQLAPSFTLPDAQGKPYAFQPGNGRKSVLAFNMGYV